MKQPRKRASAQALESLLSGAALYSAPAFSRGYLWSVFEVDQLLADIEEFAQHHPTLAKDDARLYFGSLVLGRTDANGRRSLIDGQQRLLTLAIVLAALRDRMPRGADRSALQRRLVRRDWAGRLRPRLRLAQHEHDWFTVCILTPGATLRLPVEGPAAQRTPLLEAARLVVEAVSSYPPASLRALASVLLERVSFVIVKAEDERDEARLYSVLRPALLAEARLGPLRTAAE